MLAKGSRYENVPLFSVRDKRPSFSVLRPRPIPETTGVVEHIISAGERLDLIARHYYGSDRAWWRIVDANPWMLHESTDSHFSQHLHLMTLEGRTILIPGVKQ